MYSFNELNNSFNLFLTFSNTFCANFNESIIIVRLFVEVFCFDSLSIKPVVVKSYSSLFTLSTSKSESLRKSNCFNVNLSSNNISPANRNIKLSIVLSNVRFISELSVSNRLNLFATLILSSSTVVSVFIEK